MPSYMIRSAELLSNNSVDTTSYVRPDGAIDNIIQGNVMFTYVVDIIYSGGGGAGGNGSTRQTCTNCGRKA